MSSSLDSKYKVNCLSMCTQFSHFKNKILNLDFIHYSSLMIIISIFSSKIPLLVLYKQGVPNPNELGFKKRLEYRLWYPIIDRWHKVHQKKIERLMSFPKCCLPSIFMGIDLINKLLLIFFFEKGGAEGENFKTVKFRSLLSCRCLL